MTNIDFVILNTHVTYIFKIYQKHQFFCGKTKKCKIALFFLLFILVYKMYLFKSKKNVSKIK